jgi:hypothetical protein
MRYAPLAELVVQVGIPESTGPMACVSKPLVAQISSDFYTHLLFQCLLTMTSLCSALGSRPS